LRSHLELIYDPVRLLEIDCMQDTQQVHDGEIVDHEEIGEGFDRQEMWRGMSYLEIGKFRGLLLLQ